MDNNKTKKKKTKKAIIFDILFVIALICFIGSGIYLGRYYYISFKAQKQVNELKSMMDVSEYEADEEELIDAVDDSESDPNQPKRPVIKKKFKKLYAQNSDIIGWITVEGTSIDYPVMQTPDDNEFYLHKNFNKEYEFSGLPFADARCDIKKPSENILIYGHHMNTDTMFTAVHKYKEEKFFKDHQTITFDTIYDSGEYQICYVILSKAYDKEDKVFKYYDFIDSADEKEFEEAKAAFERMSIYKTGETITREDKLITLSTCEYSQRDGRMAIIAKKIED